MRRRFRAGGMREAIGGRSDATPYWSGMNENGGMPERKRLAHPTPLPLRNCPVLLFATVCIADRRPLLATQEAHSLLIDIWRKADRFSVGRYVLMPDHIHFFCCPHDETASFKKWMEYWRSRVTRNWAEPTQKPLWQRDYWDRQMRREENYSEKWNYVRHNPVRAGLVRDPEEWPFQGELNVLRW